MKLTARTRGIFLSAGLALTLAAAFYPMDGNRSARDAGRPSHSATRQGVAADEEDIPAIILHRDPPPEDVSDVFRGTSWYVPPPPPKPAPPSPPPLPFAYIGMMQEGGSKIVFLSRQDNSYVVRQGDVLDGTYRVEKIGDWEMVLTYLPLGMKQSLNMGGRN